MAAAAVGKEDESETAHRDPCCPDDDHLSEMGPASLRYLDGPEQAAPRGNMTGVSKLGWAKLKKGNRAAAPQGPLTDHIMKGNAGGSFPVASNP